MGLGEWYYESTTGYITFVVESDVFSITYDYQDGVLGGKTNPSSYISGKDDIVIYSPTKTGYTFTGWSCTNASGGNSGLNGK